MLDTQPEDSINSSQSDTLQVKYPYSLLSICTQFVRKLSICTQLYARVLGLSYLYYVREGGLEPPHLSAQDPKSCVSTSSTTLAIMTG